MKLQLDLIEKLEDLILEIEEMEEDEIIQKEVAHHIHNRDVAMNLALETTEMNYDLRKALQGLVNAQKNGAHLERYLNEEIDKLWDAAEKALEGTKEDALSNS